jgi:FeS assembly protein IscX
MVSIPRPGAVIIGLNKSAEFEYNFSRLRKTAQTVTEDPLYWDASYAVARRLIELYPGVDPGEVTLQMIYNWVVALPEFQDDPQLANHDLLEAIYQEWYEERNST